MHALFISDLHLTEADTGTTARFDRFMEGPARTAQALYILGDLFDAWVGDDQLTHSPLAQHVAQRISALSSTGVSVYILGGNRDFVLGTGFTKACGATFLPERVVQVIDGQRVLLLHGDELCTDDIEYQKLRATMTRNLSWCAQALSQPFPVRVAIGQQMRAQSTQAMGNKADDIMDTNAAAVESMFRVHGCPLMIHGHTHRPATHSHHVDGVNCTRIVLADWQHGSGYLRWDQGAVSTQAWA
jgi:UDP-2,3-diacylglucosamine hydrolase